MLIVRDMAFAGARTFGDFQASGERIATNILASRLEKLTEAGVLAAERDPQDARSTLYRLTEKGLDLLPIVMELSRWGARHERGEAPEGVLEAFAADPSRFLQGLRQRLS